jgi:hypothetical protein
MNSTTMLMLSRALESERRREIERRPHRFVEPEPRQQSDGRRDRAPRWFRFPRAAGTTA